MRWIRKIILYGLLLTNIVASAAPLPVTPVEIPASVNSSVVRKRIQGQLPSPKTGGAFVQHISEEKTPASLAAEKIHFKLTHVEFKGNTVYSNSELEKNFRPWYDKTISLKQFEDLTQDITNKYRADGYILSRAILPPQVIKNGVVTIQVIEGYISKVEIQGDMGTAIYWIRQYEDRITQMRPLQFHLLERYILLMNDMSGLTIKAVIVQSKDIPGSANLRLIAERHLITGYLSYDNYGTRYLGPQETTVGANFNSVFLPGDLNAFRVVGTAQTTQMMFYEYVHSNPIGIDGLNYSIGGNYTDTKPGFTLSNLDIISHSLFLFSELSDSVKRTPSANFITHGRFIYENVTSALLGAPFYVDRVRSVNFGGKIDAIDGWNGVNNIGLDLEKGLLILGNQQNPNESRPKGDPNYTKWMINASHLQQIGSRFSILAALTGQYSYNPLMASNQFAYGGSDFGRGYDPAEIIGDDGVGAKFEFRMDTAPEWKLLNTVQYYVFYDGGAIWNRDNTDLPFRQSAFSAGVGARISFMPFLSGNVFLAKPLTRPVAVLKLLNENPNQFRGFFQINASL